MHWVLQKNIWGEEGRYELEEVLGKLGLPYSLHHLDGRDRLAPRAEPASPHVIAVGSYAMRHVATAEGWVPGVFDLAEQDFQRQLTHWGTHLLNHDSRVWAFRDVHFRGADELFVRPVSDSKVFTGAVYSKAKFLRWRADVYQNPGDGLNSVALDTVVQTSVPKTIHAEYRYWIVDGKIATRSQYRLGGRLHCSAEVDPRIDLFANARVREWQPHQAFVIDVCETPGGLRIVEINTINAAGIYAANVRDLVQALEALYPG